MGASSNLNHIGQNAVPLFLSPSVIESARVSFRAYVTEQAICICNWNQMDVDEDGVQTLPFCSIEQKTFSKGNGHASFLALNFSEYRGELAFSLHIWATEAKLISIDSATGGSFQSEDCNFESALTGVKISERTGIFSTEFGMQAPNYQENVPNLIFVDIIAFACKLARSWMSCDIFERNFTQFLSCLKMVP